MNKREQPDVVRLSPLALDVKLTTFLYFYCTCLFYRSKLPTYQIYKHDRIKAFCFFTVSHSFK